MDETEDQVKTSEHILMTDVVLFFCGFLFTLFGAIKFLIVYGKWKNFYLSIFYMLTLSIYFFRVTAFYALWAHIQMLKKKK